VKTFNDAMLSTNCSAANRMRQKTGGRDYISVVNNGNLIEGADGPPNQ